jgi:uncharacterized protein
MRILVSGSNGLVGSALVTALRQQSNDVRRLVRPDSPSSDDASEWDPEAGRIDPSAFDGVDAVVHLAGESIAGRWTESKKKRIHGSRVHGTRLLSETIAALDSKPRVLVSASAIGFYGDRGDDVLTEESAIGGGFLAEVCRQWEDATNTAREAGVRVALLRFGVILSGSGGALKQMLTPFKAGVGGRVGSGKQHMSWVAIDDAVAAILRIIEDTSLEGPINVVAPQTVTNEEFTKTLGRVLGRPTVMPMPAFAARLAFGQMADELLLASQRVRATQLEQAGFTFKHPQLEGALRAVLITQYYL